jgi:hypothetical protein
LVPLSFGKTILGASSCHQYQCNLLIPFVLNLHSSRQAAGEWEYPKVAVLDPVIEAVLDPVIEATCPCFGPSNGLQWANLKIAGSIVDIHRPSSCAMNNSASISINYVHLDAARTVFDGIPYSNRVDGVKYNHLSATFDPFKEKYECGEEDMIREISAAEAEACHTLLKDTCETLKQNICPCYSVQDLIQVEKGVVKKEVQIFGEKTCTVSKTDSPFSVYGVFEVSDIDLSGHPCDKCVKNTFGIQQDGSCSSTDIVQQAVGGQANHCRRIMDHSCAVLNFSKQAVATDATSCADEAAFFKDGKPSKNCVTWVAADPKRRCKKPANKQSDKRVFEFCRETCGYCACKDELDANCCKDDPKFLYWGLPEIDCAWASGRASQNKEKKRVSRCKLTRVASNCPETCGMCPA